MSDRLHSGPRAVFALILREMGSTYGRSPGGYFWVLMGPMAGIGLMTFVFSFVVRSPPLGSNFALFYATGYLPFSAYTALTARIGSAIRYSRPLLAYPSVIFLDTLISRFLLNMLTNLVVFILVIWIISSLYGLNLSLDYGRLANAWLMLAVLGFGLGVLNCYLFGAFPVWEQIWSILNRPMFMLSGVFFLIDKLPQTGRDAILWNPVVHVVCEMRAGIYPIYDGRYVDSTYVYLIGLTCTFFGLLLLNRHSRYLISEGA